MTLVLPDDPAKALAHVGQCLDLGWLAREPGLEEGEQKDDVGFILRASVENDDRSITPTLLLYPPNMSFSFLKVYLNKPADVEAFEHASKMKLSAIPEYIGNDKPERGKSAKLDAFIVPTPHPFGVVFKNNPKYSEADSTAAKQRNEIYKVPRRLFVRWADAMPTPTQPNGTTQNPPPSQAQPTRHNGNGQVVPAKPATQQQGVLSEKSANLIKEYNLAPTMARVDQLRKWDDSQDWPQHLRENNDDAYFAALDRLSPQPVGMPPR